MKRIDSLDQWNEWSELLKRHGYAIWQMQYGINSPEGFQTMFVSVERSEIEFVTFNQEVHDAIIKYE